MESPGPRLPPPCAPAPTQDTGAEANNEAGPAQAMQSSTTTASLNGASAAAKALTPEEQMELYEKQLKEDDWGHQPC